MKKICLYLYKMLFPLGICFLLLYLLPKMLFFFLPFTIGAVIAFCLNPLITFLQKKFPFFQKKQISLFLTLVVFGLFFYLCICLVQLGTPMLKLRFSRLPMDIEDLKEQLEKTIEESIPYLPPFMQDLLSDLPGTLDTAGKGLMSRFTSPALQFSLHLVSGLPELFLYLIITILSALCFSQEGAKLLLVLHENMPEQFRKYILLLKEDGKKILKGLCSSPLECGIFHTKCGVCCTLGISNCIFRCSSCFWCRIYYVALDGSGFIKRKILTFPCFACDLFAKPNDSPDIATEDHRGRGGASSITGSGLLVFRL